jgi:hypothetical protein
MFRKTKEYNTIITEIKKNKILLKEANFECYTDETAIYSVYEDGLHHEFAIMTDTFFDHMKVESLLNSPKVKLFSYSVFKDHDRIFDCIYSFNLICGTN